MHFCKFSCCSIPAASPAPESSESSASKRMTSSSPFRISSLCLSFASITVVSILWIMAFSSAQVCSLNSPSVASCFLTSACSRAFDWSFLIISARWEAPAASSAFRSSAICADSACLSCTVPFATVPLTVRTLVRVIRRRPIFASRSVTFSTPFCTAAWCAAFARLASLSCAATWALSISHCRSLFFSAALCALSATSVAVTRSACKACNSSDSLPLFCSSTQCFFFKSSKSSFCWDITA
mmetsp:Transcript_24435/g.67920  ORF Transcript_24435/g.67920 Transcript_24435/m.67920 type:complete len:240 (+) Transcript_24435:1825-2544(+)